MLTEIQCEKFRDRAIPFKSGLNVILGDENATNSIGKSTLLMVIDFVFGGKDLVTFNKDVVDELGDHEYLFSFIFDDHRYHFKRSTSRHDLVYKCNEKYEELGLISIEDYTNFLKEQYSISSQDATFRSVVGLYSRVWGKDNLQVKKPLHVVQSKRASDCIDDLIKLFDKYSDIRELSASLKKKKDSKAALEQAFSNEIVPQIGRNKYNENKNKIELIESEMNEIKNNLAKFALNINEIVNREVIELKIQKDDLLKTKLIFEGRLSRIKRNLRDNKHIKSKHLESLKTFFPSVNMDRLLSIEEFHGQLSRILKKELDESEQELISQLEKLNHEIVLIDTKIANDLNSIDNPNVIVDRVFELSQSLGNAKLENRYYKSSIELSDSVKSLKQKLHEEKEKVLQVIEAAINDKIRKIVNEIYGDDRKNPELSLKENNYKYEIFEDTGTGKAYSNLIVLDLAIFSLTNLPFVLHDSLLFKNIENHAVASLVKIYSKFEKQCFIAIDEIKKYGADASRILTEDSVIELRNDKVLYTKDWRTK